MSYVRMPMRAIISGFENLIGARSFRSSRRQGRPATGRRKAGCAWIKLQGMRNAESRPEKPCMAGEPDTEKLVRPVRWGGHRNLTWRQEKALGPHPTPPTFGHQRDLYLAVVLDLFSRMVVGWAVAAIQDATLVEQALQMALARRSPEGDYSTTLIVAVSILQNPIWHCSSSMACCLARSSTASVPATCKPLR